MSRAFLSYARTTAVFMERVTTSFDEAGVDFWIDTRDIRVGDDWPDRIAEGIEGSKVFVLFLSRASLRSKYVYKELLFSQSEDIQLRIIPVRIENVPPQEMPRKFRFVLGGVHWHDLFGDFNRQIIPLIDRLKEFDVVHEKAYWVEDAPVDMAGGMLKVMQALNNPEYEKRSIAGVVSETGYSRPAVVRLLNMMKTTGLVNEGRARKGQRWQGDMAQLENLFEHAGAVRKEDGVLVLDPMKLISKFGTDIDMKDIIMGDGGGELGKI